MARHAEKAARAGGEARELGVPAVHVRERALGRDLRRVRVQHERAARVPEREVGVRARVRRLHVLQPELAVLLRDLQPEPPGPGDGAVLEEEHVNVERAALLGVLFVVPIGGADMPVVISFLNSLFQLLVKHISKVFLMLMLLMLLMLMVLFLLLKINTI